MRSDVLFRGGENPTNTGGAYYSKAMEYINRAYVDLCRGNGPLMPTSNVVFKWALKYPSQTLTLEPKYDTGTVSVTLNSANVTFSDVIANSKATWYLIVDGDPTVYRVSTHTAGTATATLDSVFTGETDSDATYKLVKLEYTLGSNDILRLISPLRTFKTSDLMTEPRIYGIEANRFDTLFPIYRVAAGIPSAFKVISTRDNNVIIMFNKYMDEDYLRVEYDYVDKPADLTASSVTTDIRVPEDFRHVIVDWALCFLFQDKNDNRYETAISLARVGFENMVNQNRYEAAFTDPNYGQIIAREDDYGLHDRLLRTESGLIVGFAY